MRKILLTLVGSVVLAASLLATVVSRQVNTNGTAARLDANTSGENFSAVNQATTSVYLGGDATVTTSTGLELKSGAAISLFLRPGEKVYGITAGSTNRVDVLESGR